MSLHADQRLSAAVWAKAETPRGTTGQPFSPIGWQLNHAFSLMTVPPCSLSSPYACLAYKKLTRTYQNLCLENSLRKA